MAGISSLQLSYRNEKSTFATREVTLNVEEESTSQIDEGTLVPVSTENPCTVKKGPLVSHEMAYRDCMTRIQQVFEKINQKMPQLEAEMPDCSILRVPIVKPGVIKCGHVFEGEAIEQWLNEQKKDCPVCRTEALETFPISSTFLDSVFKRRSPLVTTSKFKKANQKRADQYLAIAKECQSESNYKDALKNYKYALKHTNDSKVYAEVPTLYDQLKDPVRAELSRLHLSQLQLNQNDLEGANQTLAQCADEGLIPAKVGLKLCAPSALSQEEEIAEAMGLARSRTDVDDKIFTYYQIIAYHRNFLGAYQELIPLIKDPIEQQRLLVKAMKLAGQTKQIDLEFAYRKAATTLTPVKWKAASQLALPPYPEKLREFLDGECRIWPDKKRWETHIIVPLFPLINLQNKLFPSINTSDQTEPLTYQNFIQDHVRELTKGLYSKELLLTDQEFRWGVLTYDVIPGSTEVPYSEMQNLLPPGYHFPGVLDVVRALYWETIRSATMYFAHETYTFCRERPNCLERLNDTQHRVIIGNQYADDDELIRIDQVIYNLSSRRSVTEELQQSHHKQNPRAGVAGWRTFDCPPSY
jgi:tetratricopeptide (TPR) repeat protein